MKCHKKLILRVLLLLISASHLYAMGDVVTWTIQPRYEEIKRRSADLFLFKDNDKWGLMKTDGSVILPAEYDFITSFINGYALVGKKESGDQILEYILWENGKLRQLPERYFLPKKYAYFSEGKLAVRNQSGKFGYINPEGETVVNFQFDEVLPFKEGWAPVKKGNYWKYINDQYDDNAARNTLIIKDFHFGEMTLAGCFADGLAPVAYNSDYALIDIKGERFTTKLSKERFRQIYTTNPKALLTEDQMPLSKEYTVFANNGEMGLKDSKGTVINQEVDSFGDIYADGYVIASKGGKQGILKIIEGNAEVNAFSEGKNKNEISVFPDGKTEGITIDCELPGSLGNMDIKVLMWENEGEMEDITSRLIISGTSAKGTFKPTVKSGSDSYVVKFELWGKGVLLATQNSTFGINYLPSLTLSGPKQSKVRANEKGMATVSASIRNDSERTVKVEGKWSNDKKFTKEIGPGKTIEITTTFEVKKEFTQSVWIEVEGIGKSAEKKITFKPYSKPVNQDNKPTKPVIKPTPTGEMEL